MKKIASLSLSLVVFPFFSCHAQNWAPFRFDQKVVYSTPDTLQGMLIGESLTLVQFDTVISGGDSIVRYWKNGFGSTGHSNDYQRSKSLISLYGKKLVQKGRQYNFHQPYLSGNLQYHSEAEIGQTILTSSVFEGTVIKKSFSFLNGLPDSTKTILLTIPGFESDTIYLSKKGGFITFPCPNNSMFPEQSPILLYKKFGDYDADYKGLKTYTGQNILYQLGDELHWHKTFAHNFSWQNPFPGSFISYEEKIKSKAIALWADSCEFQDSILQTNKITFASSRYVQNRKIKNQSHEISSFQTPFLQSQLNSRHPIINGKIAFLTEESTLFIGYDNNGIDGGGSLLLSTQFPIYAESSYNAFGGPNKSITPIYFKRGNNTIGYPIVLISIKERITSSVNIYPNPAIDKLTFAFSSQGKSILSVFNSQGSIVLKQAMESNSEVDIRFLKPGYYFFTIPSNQGAFRGKFLKE